MVSAVEDLLGERVRGEAVPAQVEISEERQVLKGPENSLPFIPLQGDHSGCVKPPVVIKTKYEYEYEAHVLEHNYCFDVNGRFDST